MMTFTDKELPMACGIERTPYKVEVNSQSLELGGTTLTPLTMLGRLAQHEITRLRRKLFLRQFLE